MIGQREILRCQRTNLLSLTVGRWAASAAKVAGDGMSVKQPEKVNNWQRSAMGGLIVDCQLVAFMLRFCYKMPITTVVYK